MVTDAPPRALRVLVVDDDPGVREVLVAFLHEDGHATETATNGREGLERFREGGYDVVITDCAMPELFGDELAEAIKQLVPSMPVILITGFGNLLRAAEEGTTGADVVVSKPIRFGKFRETLASVL